MNKLSGPVSFRFDRDVYETLKDNDIDIPGLIRHAMRKAVQELREYDLANQKRKSKASSRAGAKRKRKGRSQADSP